MTHDKTQKLLIPTQKSEAGEVVVDSRGRNVWQWKDEQLDSTSVVLQRLDNSALELEATRKVRVAKDAKVQNDSKAQNDKAQAKDPKRERRGARETLSATFDVDEGGGFDPYNHR